MQDPAAAYQHQMNPQFAEQEQLKCPRCESNNTKFCYYNNYNLSQPRHFCKNCRRYWTKGGSLRNIPVGGGTRKNSKRSSNPKRALSSPSSSSSSSTANPVGKPESPAVYGLPGVGGGGGGGGSFSSLLASNGQFGNLFEGLASHGSTVQLGNFGENANLELELESESNLIRNHPEMKLQSNGENNSEGFLGLQSGGEDSSCWGGGNGWPHDLAIYTPGSNFQ